MQACDTTNMWKPGMLNVRRLTPDPSLAAQGNVHMVEKIIDRGIKSLTANSVVISRDAWLKVRTQEAHLSASIHRKRSLPGTRRVDSRDRQSRGEHNEWPIRGS